MIASSVLSYRSVINSTAEKCDCSQHLIVYLEEPRFFSVCEPHDYESDDDQPVEEEGGGTAAFN